jgi:putative DNA methylase
MTGMPHTLRFYRDRLPHWLVAEQPYFVTICRKGSLPASVFADLSIARHNASLQASVGTGAPTVESWCNSFNQIDAFLDSASNGAHDLTTPAIGRTLITNLDWFRGRGWRIWAGCIMPSHFHLVMRNIEGRNDQLTKDLGLFKNYTGREANRTLGTEGPFWQRECFDHWCRNSHEWFRFAHYTLYNPVTANLVQSWKEWPWTVVDPELEQLLQDS